MGPDQESALRTFSDKPLISALRSAGDSADPRFEEVARHVSNGPDDEMVFRYTIADDTKSGARRSVWITVAWYFDDIVGEYFWQIRGLDPELPKVF